jgi:hypothetical protein
MFEQRKAYLEARARVLKAMAHPTRLFIIVDREKKNAASAT